MKTLETCLNRLTGRCKNCTRDYDPKHHPNNPECSNYSKTNLLIVDVELEKASKIEYKS